MQDEVKRILKLLEDGVLNGEQAQTMIGVLDDAERRAEHGRRAGGHHRHRHRPGFEKLFEGLGADVERAVEGAVGSVLGALRGLADEDWLDESNDATFANAEQPVGEQYDMRDNRIVVSRLAGLRLNKAAFCGNEMYASALTELDLNNTSFNGNALRGSSLKRGNVEGGAVTGNRIDGSQLAGLQLRDSSLLENAFKGAQVRALDLSGAEMRKCSLKGAKLKNVVLKNGVSLADARLSGIVGSDWTLDDSRWTHVRLKGVVVTRLVAKQANLEHCTFRHGDGLRGEVAGDAASVRVDAEVGVMRDLTLASVTMRGCEFVHCKFDGTVIENIELAENLRFEHVDFSGRTIDDLHELKALAVDAS